MKKLVVLIMTVLMIWNVLAFAAPNYEKVDDKTIKVTDTKQTERSYNIRFLVNRKKNLEAQLAEVNKLIQEAKSLGIEEPVE